MACHTASRVEAAVAAVLVMTVALCGGIASAADVVQVGALLPMDPTSPVCVSGVQYEIGMRAAVSYIKQQSWWKETGMELDVQALVGNSSYDAFVKASDFTAAGCVAPTTGDSCTRVAMVGPWSSDASVHVQYVAERARMPLVGYASTSPLLSDLPYYYRTVPSDHLSAEAVVSAIQVFGWKQYAVLHTNNQYARSYELELQTFTQGDPTLSIEASLRYDATSLDDMEHSMTQVTELSSRVIVLIAYPTDAYKIMKIAYERGMFGKGYLWIGTDWVNGLYFAGSPNAELMYNAMNGNLGILASSGNLMSYNNSELAAIVPSAAEIAMCPEYGIPALRGVAPDTYVAYAFDAVLAVARAASIARQCSSSGCVKPFSAVTSVAVNKALQQSPLVESPILGGVSFKPSGNPSVAKFAMYNVRGTSLVRVFEWQNGTWRGVDNEHITWPGGGTEVPSDREPIRLSTQAEFFTLVLFAMIASACLAHSLSAKRVLQWFPESGITVLVGVMVGMFIRLIDPGTGAFVNAAKFDAQLFSLIFLPIIIFQSGYALRKHPFFSQLGSILTYAIAGTVISTFIVGGVLHELGRAGLMTNLSLEEALAFGALISAVDPVSTLATFGHLHVKPELYALVYGESVINDAIAIVLYRTFTGFFVSEVTGSAILAAVGVFFGVLFGSALIGMLVAVITTLVLKWIDLGKLGANAAVAESAMLLLFSYAAFTITEAIHLSGIVASLMAGIGMNHYTKRNLTTRGQHVARDAFRMLADVADTIVFFQVGVNIFLYNGVFDGALVFATLVLCLLGRALHLPLLTALLNCGRKEAIERRHMIVMWFAGLRGAIAYAMSVQFPSHSVDQIVNTTSIIIVFTILVLGSTTQPIVTCFKLGGKAGNARELTAEERKRKRTNARNNSQHQKDKALTKTAKQYSKFKTWLSGLDTNVIRPFLDKPKEWRDKQALRVFTDSEDESDLSGGDEAGGGPSLFERDDSSRHPIRIELGGGRS